MPPATLAALRGRLPERVTRTVAAVRDERLTYLKAEMLEDLAACVLQIERDGVDGLVIEAGTARGGSAIVLAAAKSPAAADEGLRRLRDHPPADGAGRRGRPSPLRDDRGRRGQGPGRRDVLRVPRRSLPRGRGRVRPPRRRPSASTTSSSCSGLFEDTIQLDEPVSFAHLDGDWYESTMTCLTRIAPLLASRRADRARRLLQVVRLPAGGRRVLRRPRGLPARAPDEAPCHPCLTAPSRGSGRAAPAGEAAPAPRPGARREGAAAPARPPARGAGRPGRFARAAGRAARARPRAGRRRDRRGARPAADGTPGRALALAESLLRDPATSALGRVAAGIVAHERGYVALAWAHLRESAAGHVGAARAGGVRAVRPRSRS